MKPIIYIIDDNIVSEFAVKIVIDQASVPCEVFSFESCELGLANLVDAFERKRNIPDIILLDLKMPGMNGWEFLERLNKVSAQMENVAIYAVSNFITSTQQNAATKHQLVKGYIERPITLIEIEKILSVQC